MRPEYAWPPLRDGSRSRSAGESRRRPSWNRAATWTTAVIAQLLWVFGSECPLGGVRGVPVGAAVASAEEVRARDSTAARAEEAETVHWPGPPDRDGSTLDVMAEVNKAGELARRGKWIEARDHLSDLYWSHTLAPDKKAALEKELEELNRTIVFSSKPSQASDRYTVQPGDKLSLVAKQFKVSWELLARINEVRDPARVRSGQSLKVLQGPFDALISVGQFELIVLQQGKYIKHYRIGIGKNDSTPLGEFKVQDKLVNPTYYGPDGVIAADDPQNPLAERWIGIGNGYGIHGTIEPQSIGTEASRGCIRLANKDVEELYDLLVPGSHVLIRR